MMMNFLWSDCVTEKSDTSSIEIIVIVLVSWLQNVFSGDEAQREAIWNFSRLTAEY